MLESLVAEDREDLYSAGHLAHAQLLAGRPREALALCEEILARDPANGFVRFVRAEAGTRLRLWQQAASDYESAVAGGFRSAYVHARWSQAALRAGDPEGARRAIERGLDHYPGDGKLLLALARLERQGGDESGSERHLEQAAQAMPGDPYAWAGLVAARARKKGDKEAAAELRKLLRIPSQAENPHLHDQLARLLLDEKDFAGAVAAARRAHEIEPTSRALHKRLGWTLVKAGEDQEAIAVFQACLDAEPEDPALNRSYVAASKRLGRLDEAHAFYMTLLRRHPDAKKVFGWLRRVAREAAGSSES